MSITRFSNRVHLQELAATLRPALTFPADQPQTWPEWRNTLRAKVAELLGGLPPALPEPSAEILDRRQEEGYMREHLAIRGRDGVEIAAYLLTPTGVMPDGAKRPAVMCLHGHGWGKDDVVGEPGNRSPEERAERLTHIAAHNYDYARQFARRGFVALAPDARGFGESAEDLDRLESNCYVPGVVSLFMGIPITGQRLSDDLSALDYLCALPAVDAQRVGCVGLSEGGKRTLYLSSMDDRIHAAVISGYYTTISGWIRAWDTMENHDICNYVPGLLRYADYPDLAALIAPRPLLIEYANDDPLFDDFAVEEALARTARDYAAHGAADHLDSDIFTGGHAWSGRKSFDWIERWL